MLRLLYSAALIYWRIFRPVRVGVKLLLVREGKALLVKHSYQDAWFMPGGGVKRGERLEAAARREAHEEVGASLGSLTLFGIYSSFQEGKSDHIIVFQCEEFTLKSKKDWEIEKSEFFPLEEPPEKASPGTRRRLQEYRSWQGQPLVGDW